MGRTPRVVELDSMSLSGYRDQRLALGGNGGCVPRAGGREMRDSCLPPVPRPREEGAGD